MNTKILVGGIVGGIVYFLLGWLFYGTLCTDFFRNNMGSATGVDRGPENMIFWSLILGNLFAGLLLSYVFARISNISSAGSGAWTGGVIGLLTAAAIDFIMYGTTNIYTMKGVFADIAIFTVMSALAGAAIAMVNARKTA
jgi:hypothetical protein